MLGWLRRQPGEPCLEVAVPNAEDCWQALALPGLSKERLRYLRRRIWWLNNDLRRHNPPGALLCQKQRDNMLAYLELLDDGDPSQPFLRAELLRQLGLFTEALQALERCPSDHQATKTIKKLAEQQDSAVRRLGGDR